MDESLIDLSRERRARTRAIARPLTEASAAKAQSRATVYDLRDGAVRGLMVRVTPAGQRTFYFKARLGGGSDAPQRMIRLGRVGEISLKDARRQARALRASLDSGIDPTAPAPGARPLLSLLDLYEADLERRVVVRRKDIMVTLRRDLAPWRATKAGDLTLATLVGIIASIRDSGRPGAADWFRKCVRAFLGWAHASGHVPMNVLAGYRESRATRAETLARQRRDYRLKTPEDVRVFWEATSALPPPRRDLLRLALLLGTRRAETAAIRRNEVEADRLTIPAERAKMARPHVAPLGPLSRVIVAERLANPDANTPLLLPGRGGAPISGWSQLLAPIRESLGTPVAMHDLRRTYRWHLDRMRVAEPLAEVMIAHKRDGLVDLYSGDDALWEARVEVQEAWEAWVQEAIR